MADTTRLIIVQYCGVNHNVEEHETSDTAGEHGNPSQECLYTLEVVGAVVLRGLSVKKVRTRGCLCEVQWNSTLVLRRCV